MQKYNCIIVEDEPLAAEILEEYIRNVPFLQLVGKCPDAIYALDILQTQRIHLMFLDIHLPKLKGLDFLKSVSVKPRVIITTAYHQYALEGYEINVLDYLLKPIEFDRFLKAVNKITGTPLADTDQKKTERKYYFFNVNKTMVKVWLDEILYIESMKEYIKIHLTTSAVQTKSPMQEIEEILKQEHFIRIHRSYLVAADKIESYSQSEITTAKATLPIGRNYKQQTMTLLEMLNKKQ